MRQQSSIRQSKRASESAQSAIFNRKRLVKELLSLGNPKITSPIADSLSLEVEKEIQNKDETNLSPETISALIRFKLEEMGLIEIKSHKEKIRKIQTEKAMKVTHPFAPTPLPLRLALQTSPVKANRENFQWSNEGKKAFQLIPEWLELQNYSWPSPEEFLKKISETLAEIDSNFEGFHDNEATAIQFYNRMATLDFVPGNLLFKTDYQTGKIEKAATCHLVGPHSETIYSGISSFSKNDSFKNTTLGFQLENKAESENAALLLLKLLKTSLEYKNQKDSSLKQELYLSFSSLASEEDSQPSLTDENDSEDVSVPFASLFDWLEKEENRKFFSLSLGVPGRTLPYLSSPTSFEQNLVRILHQHLLVNSSARLYFLERCQEAMNASQGQADRAPNPQSPGFYAPGEIVPSLFLNLAVMIKEEEIDWDRLRRATRQAVHLLDNVIDFWVYPDVESEKITKSNRSIALGVMGLADLLFTLRIPYNSQEALDVAAKIAGFIEDESLKASEELAKSRGVFPNYIGSVWQEKGITLRNANICSISWDPLPSLIAQTSTGIEPHTSLVELEGFEGEKPKYLLHPFLAQTAKKRGFLNDRILARVLELRSIHAVKEIPEDVRKVFVSSQDINLHWHLLMAAAFEKHFDNGVVKVCPLNIYSNKSDNLQNLIEQARELGLRSLWIKREGEVIQPILETVPDILPEESLILEESETLCDEIPEAEHYEEDYIEEFTQVLPADSVSTTRILPNFIEVRERPEVLHGITHKQASCCGDVFVTLNQDEKGPYEILAQLSKTFGNETTLLEVVAKLISLSIQSGIDPKAIYEQLHGVICLRHLNTPQAVLDSPIETLAKEIKKLIPEISEAEEDKTEVLEKTALVS